MSEPIILSKNKSLTPKIATFFSQLEEERSRLLKLVSDLTIEELDWTLDERQFETIGTLLLHINMVEKSWIFEDIYKIPISEEEWKIAIPLRKNVSHPQIQCKNIAYYLNLLFENRKNVLEKLKEMKDDDLEMIIESGDTKFSIEWILFHLIEHEAIHIGQINFIRRLYKKYSQ